MEALEKKRDEILDKLKLEELRSFFVPPSAVASLKRDTLIAKLKQIPLSPAFIQQLRGKRFRTQYVPEYNKITVDEMKAIYAQKGIPLPKAQKGGIKGTLYKDLFKVEPPARKPRKVATPLPTLSEKEVEVLSPRDAPDVPDIAETSERELLVLFDARGITFAKTPSIGRLYQAAYFPRKLRRETVVTVSDSELNELLRLNYLAVPALYSERLEVLNKFCASFFVKFQRGKVEKATWNSFPINFVSEYPALYSTAELKRIARYVGLDKKDNRTRVEKTLANYTVKFPEEIPGLTDKDLETRAEFMALINERVYFCSQKDETFLVRNDMPSLAGEEPPFTVFFVLQPKLVYSVTMKKLKEDYVSIGGLEFKDTEVSDPDYSFRKTFDAFHLESLKRLAAAYPIEFSDFLGLMRQMEANKKLLRILPQIDARTKDKLLTIHTEAFKFIEEGASDDAVPDYLAFMFQDYKGFSLGLYGYYLRKTRLSPKSIGITKKFVSHLSSLEDNPGKTSIDILGILTQNRLAEPLAEIIVKFYSRDLMTRQVKRKKRKIKIQS